MKHLTSIDISIKGRNWTFKLISDKIFDKIHNSDPSDNQNAGMTIFSTYEVHFPKSEWDIVDIRHEILHIYKYMCNTGSTALDVDQVEELLCEIFGNNGLEMCMYADHVAERFLNYHKGII
jgi:hypothetical protein